MLIPQIVGFCRTKILQSGEFSLISFNLRKIRFQIQIQIPQIVGFCCTKNIQSGEFPLITYNLRNSPFSFQVQIPQVVGFRYVRKLTEWGIFFDFHQSEEYSEFQSTSDESFITFSCFSIVTFLRMQLFVLFKSYIMRNFLWVPYLKEIELIQAKHICKTNCSSVSRISQKKCEV